MSLQALGSFIQNIGGTDLPAKIKKNVMNVVHRYKPKTSLFRLSGILSGGTAGGIVCALSPVANYLDPIISNAAPFSLGSVGLGITEAAIGFWIGGTIFFRVFKVIDTTAARFVGGHPNADYHYNEKDIRAMILKNKVLLERIYDISFDIEEQLSSKRDSTEHVSEEETSDKASSSEDLYEHLIAKLEFLLSHIRARIDAHKNDKSGYQQLFKTALLQALRHHDLVPAFEILYLYYNARPEFRKLVIGSYVNHMLGNQSFDLDELHAQFVAEGDEKGKDKAEKKDKQTLARRYEAAFKEVSVVPGSIFYKNLVSFSHYLQGTHRPERYHTNNKPLTEKETQRLVSQFALIHSQEEHHRRIGDTLFEKEGARRRRKCLG